MRKILTLFLPVLITSFTFYQSPIHPKQQWKIKPKCNVAGTDYYHFYRLAGINVDNGDKQKQTIIKTTKKWVPSILYSILFLLSRPLTPNSNAVIGYIPKGASGLQEKKETGTGGDTLPPNTIPREILEKDYGGNERKRELEMKLYMDPTPKNKVEEEVRSSGGLRPGSGDTEMDGEIATKYQEQLDLLSEIKPQQEHKLQTIQRSKPTTLSARAKRKNKAIALAQFSAFGVVGAIWAKYQNEAEQKRVQRGIELYESNRAEFFNITGTAESDASLQKAIEDLKNSTNIDDEDYDDEDDDEDEPKFTKRTPPKPKGPRPGGAPPAPKKPSSSNDDDELSDDDIERVRRMFDKK